MEITLMMFSGLFWGGGMSGTMGLPPGERDAKLVRTAPADALVYLEWAERGPGKRGAKGIDGFAADPEVQRFFNDVWKAIQTGVEKETSRGRPEEQVLGKHIPAMVRILLSRSGCLSATLDEKGVKLAEAGPGPAKWLALVNGMKVCLVVNGGKEADAIAGHLKELVNLLPADKRKKDLNRQPIPLPDSPPEFSLTLHRHGNYFILGFGKGVIDTAIAGLDGKSQGLAANKDFAAAAGKVSFDRTANITFLNVKAGVKKAEAIVGPQVANIVKMLGLDTLDTLVTSTGVVDGEIRARSYLGTGGKTDGVLALFSGRGIKPADLAHVPADSDLVVAFSMNAANVLNAARTIVAAADKPSAARLDALIKAFENELGLNVQKDLFAAFGDVWVLHDSKSAGGFYLTSLVASLEVKDHTKALDVFTKMMDVLEEKLPGEIRGGGRFGRRRAINRKRQEFMGETIYYINIVGEFAPFAPAFCLTKTHLLVAPHPQALKAHIRFLKSGDAKFSDRMGKEFPLPEGDVLGLSYFESNRLLRLVYAFAPYFGQVVASMVQSEGAEIDIFSLPSARGVLPYFGDSFSTTVRTPQGILSESRNVNPAASAAGAFMLMPVMMFWSLRSARIRAGGGAAVPPRVIKLNWNGPKPHRVPAAASPPRRAASVAAKPLAS